MLFIFCNYGSLFLRDQSLKKVKIPDVFWFITTLLWQHVHSSLPEDSWNVRQTGAPSGLSSIHNDVLHVPYKTTCTVTTLYYVTNNFVYVSTVTLIGSDYISQRRISKTLLSMMRSIGRRYLSARTRRSSKGCHSTGHPRAVRNGRQPWEHIYVWTSANRFRFEMK